MANITLHNNLPDTVTAVPNRFIDHYMTTANGEYVKIYLYLLRCMNQPDCSFSLSRLADHFDHTEKDICRALKYWEKVRLLKLEYDSENHLSGICLLTDRENNTSDNMSGAPDRQRAAQSSPGPDALRRFCEREEIQELIFLAETYLGRTLNHTDLNFIFTWHDQLHFSADIIEFLIENCIAKGHSSLQYMQKIAEDWYRHEVRTVDQARQLIAQNSETYYTVMKSFGIRGRNLVPSEMDLLKKWSRTYNFSRDIIAEACHRTIQKIHEPSFEYADSILSRWHSAGVNTMDDIRRTDEEYHRTRNRQQSSPSNRTHTSGNAKNSKFSNFQQRNYDYEQLSKKLLKKSMN